VTGWISALTAAAIAATPAVPVRVQAVGTATVTIVRMEAVDPAKSDQRVERGTARQTGRRDGAPQIDFF